MEANIEALKSAGGDESSAVLSKVVDAVKGLAKRALDNKNKIKGASQKLGKIVFNMKLARYAQKKAALKIDHDEVEEQIHELEKTKGEIDQEKESFYHNKEGNLLFTLSWEKDGVDLDTHVTTPAGVTIKHSNRKSACGGQLDVDD